MNCISKKLSPLLDIDSLHKKVKMSMNGADVQKDRKTTIKGQKSEIGKKETVNT